MRTHPWFRRHPALLCLGVALGGTCAADVLMHGGWAALVMGWNDAWAALARASLHGRLFWYPLTVVTAFALCHGLKTHRAAERQGTPLPWYGIVDDVLAVSGVVWMLMGYGVVLGGVSPNDMGPHIANLLGFGLFMGLLCTGGFFVVCEWAERERSDA